MRNIEGGKLGRLAVFAIVAAALLGCGSGAVAPEGGSSGGAASGTSAGGSNAATSSSSGGSSSQLGTAATPFVGTWSASILLVQTGGSGCVGGSSNDPSTYVLTATEPNVIQQSGPCGPMTWTDRQWRGHHGTLQLRQRRLLWDAHGFWQHDGGGPDAARQCRSLCLNNHWKPHQAVNLLDAIAEGDRTAKPVKAIEALGFTQQQVLEAIAPSQSWRREWRATALS